MNQISSTVRVTEQILGIPIFQSQGFVHSYDLFREHNLDLMTAEQYGFARSVVNPLSAFSQKGSFIRERIYFISKKVGGNNHVVLSHDCLDYGSEVSTMDQIPDDLASLVLNESRRNNGEYLNLKSDSPLEVSSGSFFSDPRTKFLFGENAAAVSYYLEDVGMAFLPFYLKGWPLGVDPNETSCSTPIWFGGVRDSFGLFRGNLTLKFRNCYGVPKKINEFASQNLEDEPQTLEAAYQLIRRAEQEKASMTSSLSDIFFKKSKK